MHHKNSKPKTYKGHCMMCSAKDTDGTRNGRLLTPQEEAAALKTEEGLIEYEEGPEPLYLLQHSLENVIGNYWLAVVDECTYEVWEPGAVVKAWIVKASILSHGSYVAHGETLEKADDSLVTQMRTARQDIDRLLRRGSGPSREDLL